MDWLYLALIPLMLVGLFAFFIRFARAYWNRPYFTPGRRTRRPPGTRRVRATNREYQPPKPPEGRYWG